MVFVRSILGGLSLLLIGVLVQPSEGKVPKNFDRERPTSADSNFISTTPRSFVTAALSVARSGPRFADAEPTDGRTTSDASTSRRKLLHTATKVPAPSPTGLPTVAATESDGAAADSARKSDQLQEIVITAEKRAESLSRTPIAITALSQAQLTEAGVNGVANLTSVIPNTQFGYNSQFGNVFLTIRGIGNRNVSDDASPEVPVSVDGIYIPDGWALNGVFFDLNRIEVLRGPQGTLYGRNATAGAINVITADPKEQFGASADVSAGNFGDVQSHAMLNLPLTGDLAVRGAFFYHRNDGYFNTQGATARNYGATDDRGVRLTALWHPLDGLKWRISLEDTIVGGTPGEAVLTGPNGRPAFPASPYEQPVGSAPEPYQELHNQFVRSRMDWQIDSVLALTYLAGLSSNHYRIVDEGDAGDTPANSGSGLSENYASFAQLKDKPLFQELDLSYDTATLKNVAGANYSAQHIRDTSYFYIYNGGFSLGLPLRVRLVSWGVFDQATYNATSRLRLTGGIRYSNDRDDWLPGSFQSICPIDAAFSGSGANIPPGCDVTSLVGSGAWSKITWKAGLDYDFSPHTMAYLTVSTGYKAGGLNGVAGFPEVYDPENVVSYELGTKTRLLDRTLGINADVFLENYKNLQETQQLQTNVGTLNAGAARIYGVEIETNWRPGSANQISWFFTYTHATFTTYDNAIDTEYGTTYPSLAGNFLPQSPELSSRLQYSHAFALPRGDTITPSATIYWQSANYLREFEFPIDRVPAYSKTELELTYVDPTGRWTASAFVYNVEDRQIRTGAAAGGGTYDSFYAPPRTYGVRVGYDY